MKNKNNNAGYTIIELLAVVSILVIISGIITGILYSTLRGTNKTKITTEITQNGNYALSVFSAAVIDSRNILNVGGGEDIVNCTENPTGESITLQRLGGTVTVISCEDDTISSDSASLIDTSKIRVAEGTCSFYCSQSSDDAYAIPIIGVSFVLEEINSGFVENQSSAFFNTAVSVRNYSP